VACASRRGIVYVWNLQENRLYAEVRLTTGKIIALIFSGEDRLTVVAQSGAVTELPL
jgi:hypothetical protein